MILPDRSKQKIIHYFKKNGFEAILIITPPLHLNAFIFYKLKNMKTIGLLGGTSYASTLLYYQRLNQMVNHRLGGYHSCPMLLYNIDYHAIKSLYPDGWDRIPALLKRELLTLLSLRPDALMICNNTLHKGFNLIRHELELSIPVFHVIDLTLTHLKSNQIHEVLLLGTRFTMEDDYFRTPLEEQGVQVKIPDVREREKIQQIQSRLSLGEMKPDFINYFRQLSDKYHHLQAFILACTELPLVFSQLDLAPQLVDTIELQCQAAVDFQLSDDREN